MEKMKIFGETGKAVRLSRVSCESRALQIADTYVFKGN
jgi:hypothetical protein